MSIALRVLPARLELNRRDGSGIVAPRAKVSFTTFLYVSPTQTIPWWDHTGLPHFHSSVIPEPAFRISVRTRAKVSPRYPRICNVDDDGHREGHGQPAVDLSNPFVPVHGILASRSLSLPPISFQP